MRTDAAPSWSCPSPAADAALVPTAAAPATAAPPGPAAPELPSDDDDGDFTLSDSATSVSVGDVPTADEIAAGVAREAAAAAQPLVDDGAPVLSDEDDDLLAITVPPRSCAPLRREPAWLAPYRARKARRLETEAHHAMLASAWRDSQDAFGRLAAARPRWDW